MSKHLLHTETENVLTRIREYLRRLSVKPVHVQTARNTVVTVSNPSPEGGPSDMSYEGTDFSIDGNTTVSKTFASPDEWFEHFDTYVGGPMVDKLDGATGHTHTGVDGDGAKVSASNIRIDDDTTFADHMSDADMHVGAQSHPFAFFDDFSGDLSSWTITGSASIAEESDNSHTLDISSGTTLSLATGEDTWKDILCIEFDLKLASGAFVVRLRKSDTYIAYTFAGTGGTTKIDDVGASVTTIASISGGVASDTFSRCRAMLYGTTASLWANLRISNPGAAFPDEENLPAPVHVSGTTEITTGGNIEIYASSDVRLRDFRVSRTPRLDLFDVTDLTGVIARTDDSADIRHAITHSAGGSDVLDVSELSDRDGLLLTANEKELLLPGGSLHTHTSDAIILPDNTTAYNHARDASRHNTSIDDTVLRSTNLALVSSAGTSESGAMSNHYHVLPYWLYDAYITTNAWTPNSGIAGENAHFCDSSCFGASGGIYLDERMIPSADTSIVVHGQPPGKGVYKHMRYRMFVWNTNASNTLSFNVCSTPYCRITNETTETTVLSALYYTEGTLSGKRRKDVVNGDIVSSAIYMPVNIPLAYGLNSIVIYASASGDMRCDMFIYYSSITHPVIFVPRPMCVGRNDCESAIASIYPSGL